MSAAIKTGRSRARFLEQAVDIKMNPETPEDEKAFLTRYLVQVTLPHSDPGNVPSWQRKNGNLSLVIRSGWDHKNNDSIGYPYGSIPRLLLFWITTQALRAKSRKLELGDSLAGFMRDLGLNPSTGGGKRGDGKRLREQMNRLFRAIISLEMNNEDRNIGGKRWLDMQIAPEGELWWDFKNPGQSVLFGSWIELGEKFYQAVIDSPVPLDVRALAALKRSPLALDLYAWSTYKTFSLNHYKLRQQFVPWTLFMAQLGSEYSDIYDFKKKAREAFKKVQEIYSGLSLEDAEGGFVIKMGRVSVPRRLLKLSTNSCE